MRRKRLDLGLLQREVAEKLGVTKDTVHNWETDRKSPQLRFIPGIIEFLGYVPELNPASTLGEKILATRRLLGLTQKQLAQRLGVDPSTLARWERDVGRPSDGYEGKLTELLGTFADDFPSPFSAFSAPRG